MRVARVVEGTVEMRAKRINTSKRMNLAMPGDARGPMKGYRPDVRF